MKHDHIQQELVEISLSFFDLLLGPREIISLPWMFEKDHKLMVSEFFDFHKSGDFFTHIFQDRLSFNYLFEMKKPDNVRGGKRLFMLTASVPFNLLKRKDLLHYYTSMQNLFTEWEKDLVKVEGLTTKIKDGYRKINEDELHALISALNNYLGELQFIIQVMPDVISIPMERFMQKERLEEY